jgi:hypothetical protein
MIRDWPPADKTDVGSVRRLARGYVRLIESASRESRNEGLCSCSDARIP